MNFNANPFLDNHSNQQPVKRYLKPIDPNIKQQLINDLGHEPTEDEKAIIQNVGEALMNNKLEAECIGYFINHCWNKNDKPPEYINKLLNEAGKPYQLFGINDNQTVAFEPGQNPFGLIGSENVHVYSAYSEIDEIPTDEHEREKWLEDLSAPSVLCVTMDFYYKRETEADAYLFDNWIKSEVNKLNERNKEMLAIGIEWIEPASLPYDEQQTEQKESESVYAETVPNASEVEFQATNKQEQDKEPEIEQKKAAIATNDKQSNEHLSDTTSIPNSPTNQTGKGGKNKFKYKKEKPLNFDNEAMKQKMVQLYEEKKKIIESLSGNRASFTQINNDTARKIRPMLIEKGYSPAIAKDAKLFWMEVQINSFNSKKKGYDSCLFGWCFMTQEEIVEQTGINKDNHKKVKEALMAEGLLIVEKRMWDGREKDYYLALPLTD